MLSYGGVPLLVPDRGGELHRWIEQHFDFENAPIFSDCPTWMAGSRESMRGVEGTHPLVNLPVANYPPAPPCRLNTLYWPAGATRWSRGYFLVTADGLAAILAQLQTPKALIFQASDGDTASPDLVTSLWLLAPRRLSGMPFTINQSEVVTGSAVVDKQQTEQLWLLPLVDARYFWQFLGIGDVSFSESTTWTSLFSTLGTALGSAVSASTVDVRYLKPDATQFNRERDNAAMCLDAASLSVGQRVVRTLVGNVFSRGASVAAATLAENLAYFGPPIAGGYHEKTVQPASVSVSYPEHSAGEVTGDLAHYSYSPTDATRSVSGTRKQVYSTAYHRQPEASDTCSSAYTLLQCLTNAIGEDFYAWSLHRHTFTYSGLVNWNPTGIEDAITWEFGRPLDGGGWSCQTRIEALPENFGVEHQLSQTAESVGTTTTTTTTTARPASPCTGRCKYTWNDTDSIWELDTDGCGNTTTTTTTLSPASTTTTSTTANPCACSTTTTTTTTTTAAPCECLWPDHCGTDNGECTYTYCSQNENDAPDCGQASTTTTLDPASTTTTTTCDCNTTTTTTTGTPCSGSCNWVYTPGGWELTSGGCTAPCACAVPATDPAYCTETTTNCTTTAAPATTTTTSANPSQCGGHCTWIWIDATAAWYYLDPPSPGLPGACTAECIEDPSDSNGCCKCPCPTGVGVNCGTRRTYCRRVNCPPSNPGPCSNCTSTTTTTTTADPCAAECKWEWNATAEQWSLLSSPCPLGCPCVAPPEDGTDACEVAWTPCSSDNTTTTTTTTTAAPTTTTTLAPTTTTQGPAYCVRFTASGNPCGPATICSQVVNGTLRPDVTICSGPFDPTGSACSAECGENYPTTTTDPNWRCVNPDAPCGAGAQWCEQFTGGATPAPGTTCNPTVYSSLASCESACGTTTTTPAP